MIGRLLLIAAVAAGCALAQDEPPGGGGMGGGGGRGGGGGMGGGGMSMPRQTSVFDQMSTALDLDRDQKKADKALIEAAAKESAPLRDQIIANRAKIATAIQTGKPQSEMDDLVKGQSLLMAQMTEIECRTFQKMFSPLSAAQKQQGGARVFALFKGLFMKKDWDRAD